MNSEIREIPTPCKIGGEPNLFVSEKGQEYLSWVEYLNDTTDALMFSSLHSGNWSAPRMIASGHNWFVNWADFPSMVAYKDEGESFAAHWLEMSSSGTFDYNVHITQSLNAGENWRPSFIPHQDSIPAEHGFVSLLPLSANRIFATWLDGRNTKPDPDGRKGGAMTLRAATFDQSGQLYDEVELDHRICDCCQTSAALTEEGIIVAYRDRSEEEIRDIYVVRQVDDSWTNPAPVFEDNWYIAGCPVNGPSIKANGKVVAIAWYSMYEGKPEVKIAFSENNGATFQGPIRVDDGIPLGRVDVVFISEKEILVSWLEKTERDAEIRAIRVNPSGKVAASFLVASSSSSRKSGFPIMARSLNQVFFAWTVGDSLTTIKTAVMTIPK